MGVLRLRNSHLLWILAFMLFMVYKLDCSFVINMKASILDLNHHQPFSINCTVSHVQDGGHNSPNIEIIPNMMNVNQKQLELKSLAVYKIHTASNEYQTLAFIDGTNKYSQGQGKDAYSVDGHIDQSISKSNPLSFISIVRNPPSSEDAGIYTCVIDMINLETNIPYTLTRVISVYDITPLGLVSQLRKISSLERKLTKEQMYSNDLKRKIIELEERKYEIMMNQRVLISAEHQNHTYLVSNYTVPNNDRAQKICQNLGGYLLELANNDEWQFIKKILSSLTSNKPRFFIGARDDRKEGKWYWMHSKEAMNFHPWDSGEPNNRHLSEDCSEIWKAKSKPALNDIACSNDENGFICEIPN